MDGSFTPNLTACFQGGLPCETQGAQWRVAMMTKKSEGAFPGETSRLNLPSDFARLAESWVIFHQPPPPPPPPPPPEKPPPPEPEEDELCGSALDTPVAMPATSARLRPWSEP